jgi:hypothetical protein
MKFYEIAVIKSAKIPGTKYVILQGSVILIVSDYGCLLEEIGVLRENY